MNFVIFDIALLILFVVSVSVFLYTRKHNIKKDGLMILYRTKWGMRLIDKIGSKYQRTLSFLSYVSIGLGFILMISMTYLFGKIIWIYFARPDVVQAVKVPPITPLVPYLPQVFKLDFLPPFYFIYWIIIIALIAIPHEFAHGIFMRRYGIKIKSTGFGFFPYFLPVFLAAFVEQDEKDMEKAKKFDQMAVLSAGTFANILTAIFFFAVLFVLFSTMFVPNGVYFDSYSYAAVGLSGITMVNGNVVQNATHQQLVELSEEGFNEFKVGERNFVITKQMLVQQNESEYLLLYDDAPAIRNNLSGSIVEIDGKEINSREDLTLALSGKTAGETVQIKTDLGGETKGYEITLGESPYNGNGWLGVGFIDRESSSGLMGKIYDLLSSFKEPNVSYESRNDFSLFIYNLLWWTILICISVALVNMLPVGIFDGGRFFYLTILGLTGNKKIAERTFAAITYLFLILLLLIMVFWALALF